MIATATYARAWLLIEHPGPWAFDAVGGAGFEPGLLAELIVAVRQAGGRTLLIRRPGRQVRRATNRWAVVHHDRGLPERGRATWGLWSSSEDLRPAVALLGDPRAGEPVTEPLLLVCAHGVHDTCCAVRGRPVAHALAARWPEGTWECSHVGGDRFAANVIVAPEGLCFGGLDPLSAVAVMADHERGLVAADHLRGHTPLPLPSQAAVGAVLRRWGPAGLDDVRVRRQQTVQPGLWRVWIDGAGPVPRQVEVDLEAVRQPTAWLTCRAHMPTAATTYRVVEVHASRPEW